MRILLVEDDDRVRMALGRRLESARFRVTHASYIQAALALLDQKSFDVVLIDRRLPDGDGVSLCRERREAGDRTPFVVLSGMTAEHEVLEGYESCVDLYLRKPLGASEIIAHLTALLRRADRADVGIGRLTFDRARSRLVFPGGVVLALSIQERALLDELVRSPDQVVSRDALVEAIWGHAGTDSNGLDVLANRLRRKLGSSSWMLETVRHEGLMLRTRACRSA